MKPTAVRLLLASVAFAAWITHLGWLAATRPLQAPGYPMVVSRPQVMASEIDIIADIPELAQEDRPTEVTVAEVLHAGEGGPKEGETIQVYGLRECRPVARSVEVPDDWSGPGKYLVPLRRSIAAPGRYEVAPVPASPGFREFGVRRIYRATAEVRAQYGKISKP